MTEELNELGVNVGRWRIGRLKRNNSIKIIKVQKCTVISDSNHAFNIATNLHEQEFSATEPIQKLAGSIYYIWIIDGWLYREGQR